LLAALGLLDVLGGLLYILKLKFYPIFILIFLKGIWSLVVSAPSKNPFYISLSLLDIIFSLLSLLAINGLEILAFLMVAKGLISFL